MQRRGSVIGKASPVIEQRRRSAKNLKESVVAKFNGRTGCEDWKEQLSAEEISRGAEDH